MVLQVLECLLLSLDTPKHALEQKTSFIVKFVMNLHRNLLIMKSIPVTVTTSFLHQEPT